MSIQTEHREFDGFVCDYKSENPSLPGYFAVFRASLAGIQDVGVNKWAVVHFNNGKLGRLSGARTLKIAKTSAKILATLR